MKGNGFVKIIVDQLEDDKLEVRAQVKLSHVNIIDKIMLLSTFAKAIELDDSSLAAAAMTVPMFRKQFDGETINIDMSKLRGIAKTDDDQDEDFDGLDEEDEDETDE